MSMAEPSAAFLASLRAQYAMVERGPEALRVYQRDLSVPFLLAHPFSAALMDMGLGKTISVLTALNHLFEHGSIEKVLIIAPLRVATQTWPNEIALWRHTAWMSHAVIRGDPSSEEVVTAMRDARAAERESDFGSPSTMANRARSIMLAMQRERKATGNEMLHIINREMVEWLVEFHGKNWPYDCVVIDESSSFSDRTTKRWKAIWSVRKYMKRLHLLTGTPCPEGMLDLFAQINLLDKGKRFGLKIVPFRERYFTYNQYARAYKPRPGAEEEITALISDICLVMKEADYLDSKQTFVIERKVSLTPDEYRVYKKMEDELVITLGTENETIEAPNSAALAQKLLQLASGSVYGNVAPGETVRKTHWFHNQKIEELQELVDEAQRSPLLVAYWFKSSLDQIRKAFPKAVVMDKEGKCLGDWNAGKIQMLLIHPASAGHGLNMQKGPGHTLVFFDTPWSLELYLQTIKRVARQGQKRAVRVYHLVAKDTLDATIVPKLRKKEDAQESVFSQLKKLRDAATKRRHVVADEAWMGD